LNRILDAQVNRVVDAPAEIAMGGTILDHFGKLRRGERDQFEMRKNHLLNDQPDLAGIERWFKGGSSQNGIEFG